MMTANLTNCKGSAMLVASATVEMLVLRARISEKPQVRASFVLVRSVSNLDVVSSGCHVTGGLSLFCGDWNDVRFGFVCRLLSFPGLAAGEEVGLHGCVAEVAAEKQ